MITEVLYRRGVLPQLPSDTKEPENRHIGQKEYLKRHSKKTDEP